MLFIYSELTELLGNKHNVIPTIVSETNTIRLRQSQTVEPSTSVATASSNSHRLPSQMKVSTGTDITPAKTSSRCHVTAKALNECKNAIAEHSKLLEGDIKRREEVKNLYSESLKNTESYRSEILKIMEERNILE